MTWFVTQLLAGDLPSSALDVRAYLERLKGQADALLESSEKLAHVDLEAEAGAAEAISLLERDRDSVEWWAFVIGTFASALLEKIEAEEAAEMLLHAFRLQAAHSMLVYKQSLDEHVWTGYSHTKIIYDIAAAGARTPEDAEKIQALRPLFSALDEDVLHAWVESRVDIGPRIGVTNVDEGLLQGLANYHLSLFERQRQEAQMDREQTSNVWGNRIAAAGAGAAIASVIIAALAVTG